MAHKSFLPEPLYRYSLENWLREPEILTRLREETASHPRAGMQIPPDQGALMGLLTRLVGAKNCLEVGVFTGYSSLAVALALPEDGRIVACDISEEFTDIARRYWEEAGVADKIDLHLRPAVETLDGLIAEGKEGTFDLAFIDADKVGYPVYYECALRLVKPNGLILLDNVLWSGRILDESLTDGDTLALRWLNADLKKDERIDLALIPIGDGVTVVRKR